MNLAEVIQVLMNTYRTRLLSPHANADEPDSVLSQRKDRIFQEVIVETARAMKDACKVEYQDYRTMENDGNAVIEGEGYTQGHNDAVKDFEELMAKFLFSYEKKEEDPDDGDTKTGPDKGDSADSALDQFIAALVEEEENETNKV